MAERVLRARFEGDASGIKRMAAEGKQAIESVADTQAKASRAMVATTEQGERSMTAVTRSEAQRRLDHIRREVNEAVQAIDKLPAAREEKERQMVRVVETGAKRASQVVQQELRKHEQAYQQAAKSGHDYGGALDALGQRVLALAGAYVSLQTLMRGFQYNAQIETLQLGISSIVSANLDVVDAQGKQIEGAQKLAVAQDKVAGVFEQLKRDAVNTTATLPQLAAAFNAAVGSAMPLGISLDDTRKMTVQLVQAMGAMGIPLDQARQEMTSILQATISEDSQLAKNLGISNEMVKSWKAKGTLVENILAKTKDFAVAGEQAGRSWDGATSTLTENLDSWLGKLTKGSFDSVLETVNGINDSMFGPEADAQAEEWGRILKDGVDGAIVGAQKLGEILLIGANAFKEVMKVAQFLGANAGAESGGLDVLKASLSSTFGDRRADILMTPEARAQAQQNDRLAMQNAARGLAPLPVSPGGMIAPALLRAAEEGGPELGLTKMLEAGRKLGLSQEDLGKLSTLWANYRKSVEDALAKQTEEIVNGAIKDMKDVASREVKITPRTPPTTPGKAGNSGSWVDDFVAEGSGDPLDRLWYKGKVIGGAPETRGRMGVSGATFMGGFSMFGSTGASLGSLTGLVSPGEDKDAQEYLKMLEDWTKLNEKERKEEISNATKANAKIHEDSEKALRGGLEAGVSTFLDGGITNLGEATYSLSKDAFSKALVDGIMESDLKGALGGLGESLGSVLKNPVTAAIAAVAIGIVQIKDAFDDIDRHSQQLEDTRKRYVTGVGPNEELRGLMRERKGYQNAIDNPAPGWLLWGGGHNDAVRSKLTTYDSFLPDAAKSVFDSGFDESKALDFKSLDEALAYTHTQVLKFADANELSVDITNGLLTAKKEEMKAAYESAKAAQTFADSLNSYGGLMKSFDWVERLGGGPMDASDLRWAGIAATGGGLDIGKIDQDEAIRLAELYGLMQYGGAQGAPQYGGGPAGSEPPPTTRQEIVKILGYDPGFEKDADGNVTGDRLLALLDQMVLPMLAKMQELTGGGQTQSIGSLSNPDTALQFDAPQTRNIVNNNQFVVQSQAFMGSRAEAREFAMMIWTELREIEGQSV